MSICWSQEAVHRPSFKSLAHDLEQTLQEDVVRIITNVIIIIIIIIIIVVVVIDIIVVIIVL